MKRNQRGFTLMELMVVIVIVAILAAVAVPLYINYVKDAQRTEAKGAIGAIISGEQVMLQKEHAYRDNMANTEDIEAGLQVDLTESKNNWDFKVEAAGSATNGFKVTATGKANTPADGLIVYYTHKRDGQPLWEDETSTPAP